MPRLFCVAMCVNGGDFWSGVFEKDDMLEVCTVEEGLRGYKGFEGLHCAESRAWCLEPGCAGRSAVGLFG